MDIKEAGIKILDAGAVEVRDVDGGKDHFVYTTGNRGPGYVMIKGLVGQRKVLKFLVRQLAEKLAPLFRQQFDFINGNATGGMVPAWQLADSLEKLLSLEEGEIPYTYLRGSRKTGGHGELVTGDRNNPLITSGMSALVFEELVNYAETTTNAAVTLREHGYPVSHAACILSYDHPEARERLRAADMDLVALITLPELLVIAEETGKIPERAVRSYRDFLTDPIGWQLQRGLVIPADSAKAAKVRGINMRKLLPDEAISLGAPNDKVNEGVIYWAKVA
ncbi:MAG: hypothetical protein HYS32_03950 [Candidatus Woesearchaeota archaeon]|nr:MAG: hypothetical protein HYS32_03950 [Candidatus Woesearchaeota archaeon]